MPRAGKDDDSKLFRKLFIAKPGHVLLCADLDQIELRTLAYYLAVAKGDTGLLEEFNSDTPDAHTKNAKLWGVERNVAKTLIFLLIYGGQPKLMFQRKLFTTLAKAKAAFDGVEKAQPGIKELMQDVVKRSTKRGFVKSVGGRHMHYPNLRSSNKWDKMKAERQCFNALVQGSSRDIIHLLAVQTAPAVWSHGGSFVNIVHDEVLIEVPEENADALIDALTPVWHNRMDLLPGVPVNGDWNKGSTWYEAK
jgi:DNA polymerase-1